MEFYIEVITIIFFGFCKSRESQNVCGRNGERNICCFGYHMEEGRCVACPFGSFGVNCSKSCPKGYFGEFCVNLCNCTRKEICNLTHGCVENSTEDESEMSTPLFKTELSTSTLQTTELTFDPNTGLQNTISKPQLSAHPHFLYFVSAGLASLCSIVCILTIYKERNICCFGYHMEEGRCVACPFGSFGVNCSKSCPKGYFGEFCVNLCNCTRKEICNLTHGCVENSTEDESEMSTPLFKTELSTSTLQTTELTFDPNTGLQNTISKPQLSAHPHFLYFVSAGLASLCSIVCILTIYKIIKQRRRGIIENNPLPVPPPEPDHQNIPHHVEVNFIAEASEPDYAEIRQINHTYSSCAEASSVYNVLSFSRSKHRNETFNTFSGIYSTSKTCSPQMNDTTSLETKSVETDNTQVDPLDNTANTKSPVEKEASNFRQEEGDSPSFADQEIP